MEEEKVEGHNLLIKFFAGEISDSELILLKSLLEKDPEYRRIFYEENELWQEASIKSNTKQFEIDEGWNNIAKRVGIGTNNTRYISASKKSNFRVLMSAALFASLLAIGGLSLWLTNRTSFQQIVNTSTLITTNTGEKVHVTLSDNTEVTLNSESTLEYKGVYNIKDRFVKLKGEAFFDVRTNPKKPFIVNIGQLTIYATGTRFNVLSYTNEDRIETTLEEGFIQISIKGKDLIKMNSGQQLVYETNSGKVTVRNVSTDTYTSWKENKLRFNDTSFDEVLRRIARKYNVDFQITNNDLLNLKYTATFIDESIEEVMTMLKTVSPITYKIYYQPSTDDKKHLKPTIIIGRKTK